MEFSEFELYENNLQSEFENIELDFTPAVVVTINLLRCRNVSVSFLRDTFFDIPDPLFKVSCPTLENSHRFVTLGIPDNSPTCEINESFSFILPEDSTHIEDMPVEIELYDRNLFTDLFIDKQTLNCGGIHIGDTEPRTIDFNTHGELDVEIKKLRRDTPDFRYSLGLNEKERSFRKKRLPVVYNLLKEELGSEGPSNLLETPVVSLVGSGGGYRSIIGMTGAMEAFKDAGLLDMFTYLSGLSGSAWYLTAAYACKGVSADEQQNFHTWIRKRLQINVLLGSLVDPLKMLKFTNYLKNTKIKYQQPFSPMDYFPGYILGDTLFGNERLDIKMSDVEPYVKDGSVPLLLLSALHVENSLNVSEFHAYVETSPFEVYLPEFGIGLSPQTFGSPWSDGFLINKRPEYHLHYTLAIVGSALSIMLSSIFDEKEEDREIFRYFGKDFRKSSVYTQDRKMDDSLGQTDKNHSRAEEIHDNVLPTKERGISLSSSNPELTSIKSNSGDSLLSTKKNSVGKLLAVETKPISLSSSCSDLTSLKSNSGDSLLPTKKSSVGKLLAVETKPISLSSSCSDLTSLKSSSGDSLLSTKKSSVGKLLAVETKPISLSSSCSDLTSLKSSSGDSLLSTKKSSVGKLLAVETKPISLSSSFSDLTSLKSRGYSLLSTRKGRTGVAFNFAHRLGCIRRYFLNPQQTVTCQAYPNTPISLCLEPAKCMSTTDDTIRIADGGIWKNVPTETVLRPQRATDLVIVMDFSAYTSDSNFDYKPLLESAAQAKIHGIKFPKIDVESIKALPPKELLILPSDDDECPTVMWFTLCNKKFRNLVNYKPRSTEKPPKTDEKKMFNDFPVHDPGAMYWSFKFQYDVYHFDQLRELMYYNVSTHIEEIKTELVRAVERKRKRVSNETKRNENGNEYQTKRNENGNECENRC